MFEKILLPLDGSILAEAAIPYVRDLAGQLSAEIYLLHVCPVEHEAYLHMHQMYLNNIADNLRKEMQFSQGPKIKAEVILGDPVKVIFDYIKQKNIDLVALTSHGTSGFRSIAIGNVADKVVRGSGVATLLIRVKDGVANEPGKKMIEKILATFDSSDSSKISIPYVIELASKIKASVTLFSLTQTVYSQIVDGMGAGAGVNWDAIDASTLKFIDRYLQNIEDEMKKSGISVSHSTYIGMDPASEILEMEKKSQADLVVMATRGRSQVARWAFGSVAEKVLREGSLPLLLIKEVKK
jgi:nucleotide-binding universal stress UspA family protein